MHLDRVLVRIDLAKTIELLPGILCFGFFLARARNDLQHHMSVVFFLHSSLLA